MTTSSFTNIRLVYGREPNRILPRFCEGQSDACVSDGQQVAWVLMSVPIVEVT